MFWGIYGCKTIREDIEVEKEAEKKTRKMYFTKRIGIFISEFIGSFAGWCCLYILVVRLFRFPKLDFSAFGGTEIFLTIAAVIGIAGYSYELTRLTKEWKK
jgi:hypothetical protein